MRKPIVRHPQEHAGRGRDAGQRAGKHAHQRADVDQYPQHRNAAYSGEHVHLIWSGAQILTHDVEAQHFRVRTHREESSRQNRTLNHRARNRLQRIARLGAQRGGALKAHKTEQRQYQAEAEPAPGHAVEMEFIAIQVPAVMKQHEPNHDHDHRNRCGFNPQHEPRGNLHVAIGNPDRNSRDQQRQQRRRENVPRGIVDQQVRIVIEPANHARSRGHVGQQQAPGDGCGEPRRQGHRRVGIERPGRSRMTRIARDAQSHQKYRGRRQDIREPCPVPRESADQRNRSGRRCGRRHGGHRLRQSFHGRKNSAPQTVVRALGRLRRCWLH